MVDRSVEVALRMQIAQYQRAARQAGRDTDDLTASMAALDAQIGRVEASSTRAAEAVRQARTQTRGLGRDAGRAAPQIDAARASVDAFNASVAAGTQHQARFGRQTQTTGQQVDQAGRTIDRFSGRMGLAIDGVLTMASALVPLGAVAGQGAAGLAAMGAAAVVAAGSAVVAFQGVGDAVKALQAYQDDPTADNLTKAREELDKLAPAAQAFVVQWQRARPLLDRMQESGAQGWFPGLTKALEGLDELEPKVSRILQTTGAAGGFLVDDAVKSLGGDRWEDFLEFLADEVPSAMTATSRIMGDLTHGAAEMWMKLDPGNDDFIAYLEDVANGFDSWASSAEGRDDIEAFLAYARESGPQVAEFMSAAGGAFLDLVKAAAPLGGPTLAALTAVFNVIGAIAASDMATPILAALAALRLFNRAQAVMVATQARAARVTGSAAGAGGVQPYGGIAPTQPIGPMTAAQAALFARQQAAHAAGVRRNEQAARRAALRANAVRGSGMALGVGLLASGAASDLNLTNTAMLGLAGSMAGPFGAAAGAAAGAAMDAAAANDDFTASVDRAQAVIKAGDFSTYAAELAAVRAEAKAFADDNNTGGFTDRMWTSPGEAKNLLEGLFGESDIEENARALAELEEQMAVSEQAAAGLGEAFGMSIGPLDGSARSVEELQRALEAAKPAMDQLGISQEDLNRARAQQNALEADPTPGTLVRIPAGGSRTPFDDLTDSIRAKQQYMDSAIGKLDNYRAVIRGLAEDEGNAADQADRFREAMAALVDPALDAEEALSRQREVLKSISELDVSGGFTDKNEIGRQNLEVTRDYTAAVQERIATMINANRSETDIGKALKTSREQFIASGKAAGFSAEQMQRRADKIGLTPKLIETTFQALGITKFDRQVADLQNKFDVLPRRVRTELATDGIPKTEAQVDALVAKYKLTEKQRRALITLVDQASGKARAISAVLDQAARDRSSTITVTTTYRRRIQDAGAAGAGPLRNDDANPRTVTGGGSGRMLIDLGGAPQGKLALDLGDTTSSNARGRGGRGRRDPNSVDFDAINTFAVNVNEATGGLKGLRRQLRESERALEKERRRRDQAIALRDSVGGSLSIGEMTGGGLSGFDAALQANTNDTLAGLAALNQAEGNGLGGRNDTGGLYQFLANSKDLALLQQFAGLSPAQIRERERQFASLERAEDRLGNAAVMEEFGESVKSMSRDIRQFNKTIDRLEDKVERATRRGAREGSEAGTRAGNQDKDRRTSARVRAGR